MIEQNTTLQGQVQILFQKMKQIRMNMKGHIRSTEAISDNGFTEVDNKWLKKRRKIANR